uniref:Pecanex-like protein n=1 Tax=Parastrongyloides trichosuri TaxID=131310 RepID=A0A0N4ZHU5_PARTI
MFDHNEPCKSIVVKRRSKKNKKNKKNARRRQRRASLPPTRRPHPRVDVMIPIRTIEQINQLREQNYATLNALDDFVPKSANRNTRASSVQESPPVNQSQSSCSIQKDFMPIDSLELLPNTAGPSNLTVTKDESTFSNRKYSDPIYGFSNDKTKYKPSIIKDTNLRRTISLNNPKTDRNTKLIEDNRNDKSEREYIDYDSVKLTFSEVINEKIDLKKISLKENNKEKDNIVRSVPDLRIVRKTKREWIPDQIDLGFVMDISPEDQRKTAKALENGEKLDENGWFLKTLNHLGDEDFLNSLERGCTEANILKSEIIKFMEALSEKYPVVSPKLEDIKKRLKEFKPTIHISDEVDPNLSPKRELNDNIKSIVISDPDQPGPSNINSIKGINNDLLIKSISNDKNVSPPINRNSENRASFHFQYPDFPTRYQPVDIPEYEKDLIKNNGCDLEYDVRNMLNNLMKASIEHNFKDDDEKEVKKVKIQSTNRSNKRSLTRTNDHISIHSILSLSDADSERSGIHDEGGRANQSDITTIWRSDSSMSSIVHNVSQFRTNFRGLATFLESLHNNRSRRRKGRQQNIDRLEYKIANYYELRFCPKCLFHIHKTSNGAVSNVNESNIFCKKFPAIKLKMDRLFITSLFDKNRSFFSCIFDIFTAVIISILAGLIIYRNIYVGSSTYFFGFVVAGAHFSLLKSVQPDASSPVHGFNWIAAYSRPFYFSSISILLLCSDVIKEISNEFEYTNNGRIYIFGLEKITFDIIIYALNSYFYYLLLFLPFAAMIGTLPQITTLFMHIFEQIDMFFFGGTATVSLNSSIISLTRSLFTIVLLSTFSLMAFNYSRDSTDNLLFSLYNASLISLSYFNSRYSSNYSLVYHYLKRLFKINPIEKLRNAYIKMKIRSRAQRRNRLRKYSNTDKLDRGKNYKNNIPFTSSTNKNEEGDFTENVEMKELLVDDGNDYQTFQGIKDTYMDDILNTIGTRLQHDLFSIPFIILIFFAFHSTLLFHILQPWMERVLVGLSVSLGFFNHYLYPHFRAKNPWKVLTNPIFKPMEFWEFESKFEAEITLFEKIHMWLLFIERNLIYPLLITSLSSTYAWSVPIFPPITSTLILFKICRTAYSQPYNLYSPLFFTYLLIFFDFSSWFRNYGNEIILWYILTLIWPKLEEFKLKLDFIFAYIAPWQISWGSAFHAFVQPFSAPHSGFLALVTFVSSIFSAPLNPFLGSSFFLMSYMRPVKFWEKDYNTKQYDYANAKLCDQMETNPVIDDANLNAVFYEHMTRSLQKYLAGDLAMGRWGSNVEQGDCFLLTSLNMNCLVHIIEIGNGFITFQVRGLEFHGTYCHQREVEAISEDPPDIGRFFCFYFKGLLGFLPLNTILSFKWMAWEVTASKYIIDGYSITDNSALNLLQVHELRRLLVTLYVKSIIYYALNSRKFYDWISNGNIKHSLKDVIMRTFYFDDDSYHFNSANDEDFDSRKRGISRVSFNNVYKKWILFCLNKTIGIKHPKGTKAMNDTNLITAFCFALSLVGRRILSSAAYNCHSNAAEAFLHGLHSLFKGDFRVTAAQDEWVFEDLSILNKVLSPAVRMALKLHQDHFASSDDFDVMETLYLKIGLYHTQIFISHEHDPLWRNAVMANIPSLLALRHVFDDGANDFKVIMLNKMFLNMRVIKLNRECVRAFWAGQQQELIFLRNRNAERGSIQNAKQVLRNMINSSADQPIGYPIYVSPLTTSYVETHHQIEKIVGGSFSVNNITSFIHKGFAFLREMITTSNSTNLPQTTFDIRDQITIVINDRNDNSSNDGCKNVTKYNNKPDQDSLKSNNLEKDKCKEKYPSVSYHTKTSNGSNAQNVILKLVPGNETDSVTKVYHSLDGDDTLSTGSGKIIEPISKKKEIVIKRTKIEDNIELRITHTRHDVGKWAKIADNKYIQDHLNEKMKSLNRFIVHWPNDEWRQKGGLGVWPYFPQNNTIGEIVHIWSPFNPDPICRSHAGFIYLTIFCSYYSKCLEMLEEKHRECLMYSENKQKRRQKQNECEVAKKSSHKLLQGYLLRRVEIMKDCVNENTLESGDINTSDKKNEKCHKIIKKYLINDKRDGLSTTKLSKKSFLKNEEKDKKSIRQIRRCNKTKKFWQKQCHSLSNCCSISKKCEMGNAKLMEIKSNKERKIINHMKCNHENKQ